MFKASENASVNPHIHGFEYSVTTVCSSRKGCPPPCRREGSGIGGLEGVGVSKLPSLELLECRELVREMGLAPGDALTRWCLRLGGGVVWPRDAALGEEDVE
jgi:hypothetical protein